MASADSTNDRQSRVSLLSSEHHMTSHQSDNDVALLAEDTGNSGTRMDKDDLYSQSSRTSGIEADYLSPNSISTKTGYSYCKEHSPFSSSGNSSYSDEHSLDGFLNTNPQLARHYHENKRRIQRSGPDPPLNIRVHPSSDGTQLVVSWTPVRSVKFKYCNRAITTSDCCIGVY